MDKTVIGIALFALVIVVGLIVGLRLSSPGPQRKAVGISFGLMAIIAALFYVFAIVFSLPWSALVFAVLAIVAPIATYSLIVRHAKAPITVSRRNPNDPPRPPRDEDRTRAGQQDSPLEPSAASATPHPGDDYYDYDQDEAIDDPDLMADYEAEDEALESAEEEAPEIEPVSPELAEAFIDEYLVGENEIEDGFFEPEPSPTLRPHKEPDPVVSSSMMVTVPHPEGNERFLVVSESREPANPILAYRRTTSSHLVHLGVAKDGEDNEAPLIAAALAAQRDASVISKYTTPADDFDFEAFEPEEARMPVSMPVAAQPAVVEEAPVAAAAAMVDEEEFEFERVPKHARAKHAPKPAVEAVPAREPEPVPETASAPAPEPVVAARPEPAPDFSFSLETVFEPEPERTPEPAYEPLSLFDLQVAEAPESVEVAEPAATVAAPVPAAAPQPVSQPAAAPKPELTPFESYMAKAESLRAKGVFTMAARIYNEAAIAADSTADNHRARFEEIACYVAAGQGEKAQAVAATLRASSVLTKVERFKLNAIERMA